MAEMEIYLSEGKPDPRKSKERGLSLVGRQKRAFHLYSIHCLNFRRGSHVYVYNGKKEEHKEAGKR